MEYILSDYKSLLPGQATNPYQPTSIFSSSTNMLPNMFQSNIIPNMLPDMNSVQAPSQNILAADGDKIANSTLGHGDACTGFKEINGETYGVYLRGADENDGWDWDFDVDKLKGKDAVIVHGWVRRERGALGSDAEAQ